MRTQTTDQSRSCWQKHWWKILLGIFVGVAVILTITLCCVYLIPNAKEESQAEKNKKAGESIKENLKPLQDSKLQKEFLNQFKNLDDKQKDELAPLVTRVAGLINKGVDALVTIANNKDKLQSFIDRMFAKINNVCKKGTESEAPQIKDLITNVNGNANLLFDLEKLLETIKSFNLENLVKNLPEQMKSKIEKILLIWLKDNSPINSVLDVVENILDDPLKYFDEIVVLLEQEIDNFERGKFSQDKLLERLNHEVVPLVNIEVLQSKGLSPEAFEWLTELQRNYRHEC